MPGLLSHHFIVNIAKNLKKTNSVLRRFCNAGAATGQNQKGHLSLPALRCPFKKQRNETDNRILI